MIGASRPASVEGESLVGALNDPGERMRETLYFAYVASQRAVKNRTHKLIEYAPREGGRQTQLFDIERDPWETNNLAGDPGCQDMLADLRQEMFRYRDAWESGHTERSARFLGPLFGLRPRRGCGVLRVLHAVPRRDQPEGGRLALHRAARRASHRPAGTRRPSNAKPLEHGPASRPAPSSSAPKMTMRSPRTARGRCARWSSTPS